MTHHFSQFPQGIQLRHSRTGHVGGQNVPRGIELRFDENFSFYLIESVRSCC